MEVNTLWPYGMVLSGMAYLRESAEADDSIFERAYPQTRLLRRPSFFCSLSQVNKKNTGGIGGTKKKEATKKK